VAVLFYINKATSCNNSSHLLYTTYGHIPSFISAEVTTIQTVQSFCDSLDTHYVSPSSVSHFCLAPPNPLPKLHQMLTVYSDLVMCRKQSGIAIGRLCDKCDGKCPVCDSYVRPTTLVRICDECSFGNYQNKCVVCGGEGISDAFYCFECTRLEKDRDGCPKIINLG
jgi:PHD finger-like domain-containing protein 5A